MAAYENVDSGFHFSKHRGLPVSAPAEGGLLMISALSCAWSTLWAEQPAGERVGVAVEVAPWKLLPVLV